MTLTLTERQMEVLQVFAYLYDEYGTKDVYDSNDTPFHDAHVARMGCRVHGYDWSPGKGRTSSGGVQLFPRLAPILGALRKRGLIHRREIVAYGEPLGCGCWNLTPLGAETIGVSVKDFSTQPIVWL